MIFHVVAIRELFGTNYSVDLLFFWVSEEKIREILGEYKLVILQLYEYKKQYVESYWVLKILINFAWQEIKMLSNAKDLAKTIYSLSILWFDIKNINYVDNRSLEQTKIDEIIKQEKDRAEKWTQNQEALLKQKKAKDEKMFNDQELEKALVLVNDLLKKIPDLIEKSEWYVPDIKLKHLFEQWQELSKLKMWSNTEKIVALLETVYNEFNEIEQEYLSIQDASRIDVVGSKVSDIYVMKEIQKLEKAKWLFWAWWARSGEDVWYANLWWFLLYLKMVKKDLFAKAQKFSAKFIKIFWYLLLWLIFTILLSTIYIRINKIMYSPNMNDYAYVMLVYFWVFWLVLYGANFLKREKIFFDIILLLWWILISISLIFSLKQNFIF